MEAHTRFTDRIAQLISIRIGSNLPPITTVSKDLQNVSQLLDRFPVGHLVLFNGGPSHEAAAALETLQRQVDVPLLIGMDMENGSGQQISDHTLWPHALAFDALGGDAAEAVERFAEYSAQQAASIGIHISFSPVLDIHRNSNNPIIATRAFGTTPSRVIELGRAYVRGCHAGGLLCCGKHFPGHGNTVADSHQELPVVLDSIDVLRGTDLATFRQFVREEIDMLMTAHVAYPQLDASRAPATLSEPILTNILRGEWKYQGLVISDSFKMEGIRVAASRFAKVTTTSDEATLAIQAIKAGVDLLLDVSDVESVVRAIEDAAQQDELLQRRIDESSNRVWQLKCSVFADQPSHDKPTERIRIDAEVANQHARSVAGRSIRTLQDTGTLTLPLPSYSRVHAIVAHPSGDHGYTRTAELFRQLEAHSQCKSITVLAAETPSEPFEILESATSGDVFLIVLLTKPSKWPDFGLPAWQHQLIEQMTFRGRTVITSLGIAEVLDHYPRASIQLATFSDSAISQTMLVEYVLRSNSVIQSV